MNADELQRLSTLRPDAGRRMWLIIEGMRRRGLDPYVGTTRRSKSQQAEAQARGTTSKDQDWSWHMLDLAVDFRKRLPNGQADPTTHDEAFFLALYHEAVAAGCRSLAYKPAPDGKLEKLLINGKTWDAGHVEFRAGYATLAEAVAELGKQYVA